MGTSITFCLIFQVRSPSKSAAFLFKLYNLCRTGDDSIFKGTSVTPSTTPYFKRDFKKTLLPPLPKTPDVGV